MPGAETLMAGSGKICGDSLASVNHQRLHIKYSSLNSVRATSWRELECRDKISAVSR